MSLKKTYKRLIIKSSPVAIEVKYCWADWFTFIHMKIYDFKVGLCGVDVNPNYTSILGISDLPKEPEYCPNCKNIADSLGLKYIK